MSLSVGRLVQIRDKRTITRRDD